MKKPICLLALALILLSGCISTAAPPAAEGPVRLGEIAYVSGPRVRPDRLIEDSRCPSESQCVWAGRVVVRATVFGGTWTKQLELTLGVPVQVADGTLELVSAVPERDVGEPSAPEQLRFTFAFQGGI